MAASQAIYNLYCRNWDNNKIDETGLESSVEKGIISQEQCDSIKERPRNEVE